MSNRILVLGVLLLGVGAAISGYAIAGLDDRTITDAAVADALAAVTPEPTPEPTPIPTPLIVTVAPPECNDALDMMNAQDLPALNLIVDIYGAYLDHPGEDMADFGRRVEALITTGPYGDQIPDQAELDEMTRLVAVCRAAR